LDGWTKTYTGKFIEAEATSTETYGGERTEWGSERITVYARQETMVQDGAAIWSGETYVGCGYEGLFAMTSHGWAHDISYDTYVLGETEVEHTAPRTYLPEVTSIGTGVSWDFSYEMSYPADGTGLALVSIPVTGTYTDNGLKDVEASGVIYEDAWHISATYTMELTTTGFFTRDYPAEADFYYAEGLGLIKELHTDTETGSIILSKDLVDMVWDVPPDEEDVGVPYDDEDTGVPLEDTWSPSVDTGSPSVDTGTPAVDMGDGPESVDDTGSAVSDPVVVDTGA
jgi:hypothetical protein